MTVTQIEQGLEAFHGTLSYHRFNPLMRSVVLTDGARYLAENAKCFWLMDVIASAQLVAKVRREPFQCWTITCKESKALIVCDDGDGKRLYTQRIGFTDFPLASAKVWLEDSGDLKVILLPSEH
jgi:hypothetical protein